MDIHLKSEFFFDEVPFLKMIFPFSTGTHRKSPTPHLERKNGETSSSCARLGPLGAGGGFLTVDFF